MLRSRYLLLLLLLFTSEWAGAQPAGGVRLRDIAFFHGARENQLVGYGLVSGIAGNGDRNPIYSLQTIANMLQRYGINLNPARITSRNVAAVMVTADIPPFARSGTRIDVSVSAIGDALTLQGGVLLQTPLMGADGKVYAAAQGPLSIGGLSATVANTGVVKNHPTSGQIVGGALVEKEIPVTMVRNNSLELVLRDPDFTMASRAAEAINRRHPESSQAVDGGTVRIQLPAEFEDRPVDFIAQVQALEVRPEIVARVIINEKTGTIVATSRVRVANCAIAHGNIVVSVAQDFNVSQPNAFAGGTTVVTPATDVTVSEAKGGLVPLPEMPTVEQVAASLNSVGATPRDIISIFQALKQAGALQAELIVR